MKIGLYDLESELKSSKGGWAWFIANVISEIPPGYLANYGTIAGISKDRFGTIAIARAVANLRKRLYERTQHEFDPESLPLHRIASKGDEKGKKDSIKTQHQNKELRSKEGSWENPKWWKG